MERLLPGRHFLKVSSLVLQLPCEVDAVEEAGTGGVDDFLELVDGKGKSWTGWRLYSPPVGSTASAHVAVDRWRRTEFPGKSLKRALPSALGCRHTLSPVWLLGDSSLPTCSQASCAFGACQWTSDNRCLIPACQTFIPRDPSRASPCCLAPYLLPAKRPKAGASFFFSTAESCGVKIHIFHICSAVGCVWHTCWCRAGEKCILFPKGRGWMRSAP